jgi:hypothetical protein
MILCSLTKFVGLDRHHQREIPVALQWLYNLFAQYLVEKHQARIQPRSLKISWSLQMRKELILFPHVVGYV